MRESLIIDHPIIESLQVSMYLVMPRLDTLARACMQTYLLCTCAEVGSVLSLGGDASLLRTTCWICSFPI